MTVLYRATVADAEVMAAVHASAFPLAEAWSRDVFSLQLALPNVFGLYQPSGGMILVRVAADEAEILTLAVAPPVRRTGIGRTLLREAVTLAASLGARSVFLEVAVSNVAALAVYAGAGFVQAGRRARYYSDNADALILRFDVRASPASPRD